jgi:hypothetical protein
MLLRSVRGSNSDARFTLSLASQRPSVVVSHPHPRFMSKRQNTKLESEGAEFLVLGNLLIEGISAYKAYVNSPGYDLTAVNPEARKIARIQVKSRWATNYDRSFPIKNFECDFVVHVALNRGYAFGKETSVDDSGVESPVFYVFPVDLVRQAQSRRDSWGKVPIRKIPEVEKYRDNWKLIRDFLGG